MLFNSYEFIFLFLPISIIIFFLLGGRGHHKIAMSWLVAASLFFYGWWNPAYLGLIILSLLFNYAMGVALSGKVNFHSNKLVLFLGIFVNLALIAYFKYANFFIDNVNSLSGSSFHLEVIILPLAISFFTFQQIAYLVDAYRGEAKEYDFLQYCLFVTFFPQLIAGPIVHHKEMMPQFAKDIIYKVRYKNLAIGFSIFCIGLFKKVVLADTAALYVAPVFELAELSGDISLYMAWSGAIAYTFQLYFDFSGYSDMAIGIAMMFGIKLPFNFNSPYKSFNIIEFWRRWHMTLSRFLRDYLYISLGGNRKGKSRRHINLMVTMILGGLWHGAAWTFVAWGTLHGLYLVINHVWHAIRKRLGHDLSKHSFLGLFFGTMLTFIAVVISWVFFRAESFTGAINILSAMADFSQIGAGLEIEIRFILFVFILMFLVLVMPNSQQIVLKVTNYIGGTLKDRKGEILKHIIWRPSIFWAYFIGAIFAISIILMERESEFLYFQF